ADDRAATDGPSARGGAVVAPGAVAVALRRLTPPEHGPTFWDDLDRRLTDEPQLRLAPRAAIRPITQPPPVIDDRKLAEHLAEPRPRAAGRSPARLAAWGLTVVLSALFIAAALQDPDGETTAAGPNETPTSENRTPTSGGDTTTTQAPTSTAPPGGVDPVAVLAPAGVGPLKINTPLRDLQAAGVAITVDQTTFDASGGTCFDAQVTGALDLELRFRSPEAGEGVADPADGFLAAVGVKTALPTTRTSDTRIALGAPQDQVLGTYKGNLTDISHPYVPGGHIYVASVGKGTGLGIAYLTDGATVTGITAGAEDVIRYVDGCS
ncbi:MAG: hypothetical protein ACRDZN_09855, partial [Acidimicrobiales bacterium]